MGLLENSYTNLPQVVTLLLNATGATNIAAAPGSDLSLVIMDINVNCQTTTTGFQELSFGEAGGTLNYRVYGQTKSTNVFSKSFEPNPWILSSNTAFALTLSVTAASTPGLEVTVMYRTLARRK